MQPLSETTEYVRVPPETGWPSAASAGLEDACTPQAVRLTSAAADRSVRDLFKVVIRWLLSVLVWGHQGGCGGWRVQGRRCVVRRALAAGARPDPRMRPVRLG